MEIIVDLVSQLLDFLAGQQPLDPAKERPWSGPTLFVGVIAWGYVAFKHVKDVSELINKQRDALVAEQGVEESAGDWILRRKLSHRTDWKPWNIATMLFIGANAIGFFLVCCATAHHQNWVVSFICFAYFILSLFGFTAFIRGYSEDNAFIRRRLAFINCSEAFEGWEGRSVRIAAGTNGRIAADFMGIHRSLGARVGRIYKEREFEERALLSARPSALRDRWTHQLFVAYSDGFPVGRIAIHVASNTNQSGGTQDEARFGFFECIDSARVASGLLDAASDWARGHSLGAIRGPFSWSMHGRVGVQVGGFGEEIYPLVEDSPPYYGRLLESVGATTVADGESWRYWVSKLPKALVVKSDLLTSGDVKNRPLGPAHFVMKEQTEVLFKFVNERLRGRPGWTDVDTDDVRSFVLGARPDFDPEICRLFVEKESRKSLGVIIAIPNYLDADAHRPSWQLRLVKVLRRALLKERFVKEGRRRESEHGSHSPHWVWSVFRRLRRSNRPQTARVIYIVTYPDRRPEDRHLLPHMLKVLHEKARALGYSQIEFSVVWSQDERIRASLEKIGARPYKQFRVYEYSQKSAPTVLVND